MNNIILEQIQKPVLSTNLKLFKELKPLNNETPSKFAERLGLLYSSKGTLEHKKEFGQYFTNEQIANFMASLSKINKPKIKVLDPGCGIAILSCALSEHLVKNSDKLTFRN